MTTATSFDLRQRRVFNPACTCTTQVSTYTLDQQEEMATVLAVLRWRHSATNTNAYSPRHTLLSASSRSWLSMRANHHDSPLCNLVHEGTHRRHVSQTWRSPGWTARTAHLACPISRSCSADVKLHMKKRQRDELYHRRCPKEFHLVCQT